MTEYVWLGVAVVGLTFAFPIRRQVERGLDKLETWICKKIEKRMKDKPIILER
jgi:hypothetical protein